MLYASVAEFVLHRGRAFEAGRLGDAERHGAQRIARWCRAEYNGFRFKQPFWTTRRALEFDVLDQFHYVEGFVLDRSETVPRPHAWLSAIANDAVVDFTGPRARKRRARKYSPMVLWLPKGGWRRPFTAPNDRVGVANIGYLQGLDRPAHHASG